MHPRHHYVEDKYGIGTGKRLALAAVAAALAVVASTVYLIRNRSDTTLEFEVRDSVSKAWVWDATISLQGRMIRDYFQSDHGPIPVRFTHLRPGSAELEIDAPDYVSQKRSLFLKRGENRIDEPIYMLGYEISGLNRFIIVEKREGDDLVQEIRPVNGKGSAILNHPCLDIWVGARIAVQMKNGLPVQQETQEGAVRGEELFSGVLEWQFDQRPEATFRYSARIAGAQIKATPEPYWVIDYLIIVPDPRKISKARIDEIMQRAWALPPDEIESYLKPYKDQGMLIPYVDTSWNVQGHVQ